MVCNCSYIGFWYLLYIHINTQFILYKNMNPQLADLLNESLLHHWDSIEWIELNPMDTELLQYLVLYDESPASDSESESDTNDYEPDRTIQMNQQIYTPDIHTEQCSICHESHDETKTVGRLICDHYFHQDCIHEWGQRSPSCPICRTSILCK
jgi:hypothetical protein